MKAKSYLYGVLCLLINNSWAHNVHFYQMYTPAPGGQNNIVYVLNVVNTNNPNLSFYYKSDNPHGADSFLAGNANAQGFFQYLANVPQNFLGQNIVNNPKNYLNFRSSGASDIYMATCLGLQQNDAFTCYSMYFHQMH